MITANIWKIPMDTMDQYRLVDLKALSRQFSISVPTLRKYRRRGMPHYNLGRKILVDPDEFHRWLDERYKVNGETPNRPLHQVVADVLKDLNG